MSRAFEALHRAAAGPDRQRGSSWEMLLSSLKGAPPPSDAAADASGFAIPEPGTLAFEPRPEDRIFAWQNDDGAALESIRILAGRLNYLQQRLLFKTLLITSSTKNEGKTMLAANLGITLASRDGKRVLLIDGDARQASLTRVFGADSMPGLTDCLESGRPPRQYLRRMPEVPLSLLPIGRRVDTPLRAEDLAQLLCGLSDGFDWIVIDSAPVTLQASAAAWSVAAERYLFVVRRGITPMKLFTRGLESINQTKLLGAVMNDCNDQIHAHYARYYQRGPAQKDKSS